MKPNKILIIVIGVVLALFILSGVKDFAIKVAVENGVEMVTGLQLKMQSFRAGLLNTIVDIRGLKLFNPKSYEDRVMVDMPEIYVDYDLPAILGGTVHLKQMRVDLREFVVVKNRNGELNLNALNVVKKQQGGGEPAQKGKAAAMPKIQIDELRLKIGKAIYKDYSAGGAPKVKEFNVNLDERYTNIRDPYSLVSLIVVKAMANTSISSMSNFDLKGLQGTITDTLQTTQKLAGHTSEVAKSTLNTVTKTAQSAQDTAKQLGEVFKSPFGK